MTQNDSQFNGSSQTPASNTDFLNLTGFVGGYHYKAPNLGRDGVSVTTYDSSGEVSFQTSLPPIYAVTRINGEVTVLVPQLGTNVNDTHPIADIAKNNSWARSGYIYPAKQLKALVDVWFEVVKRQPIVDVACPITAGQPPLAPELTPGSIPQDVSREAWVTLGKQLTPKGRFIMGLTLMSPWLKPAGGTSAAISIWGQAGAGKTIFASMCAALFGSADFGAGLIHGFNSTGQGLTSLAQTLSYYPLILDESITSEQNRARANATIEYQLSALVSGASRLRAGRDGRAVRNTSRWDGIVLITSNSPITVKHEMFTRRFLEINGVDLWVAGSGTWSERADLIKQLEGWPWHVMCEWFPRNKDTASLIANEIRKMPEYDPQPNLSILMKLAAFGASVISDWTGDKTWLHDVVAAGQKLAIERREFSRGFERDPMMNIVEKIDVDSGMFDDVFSGRDKGGYWDKNVTQQCVLRDQHGIECKWLNIFGSAFTDIAGVDIRSVVPDFDLALLMQGGKRTRQVLRDGHRSRVVTVCVNGLNILAYEDADALAEITENPPETPHIEYAKPQVRDIFDEPQAHVVNPQRFTITENVPLTQRVWAATNDDNITSALNNAAANVTDLVGPDTWGIDGLGDNWDAGDWAGQGISRKITRGNRSIRIWRMPEKFTPEQWCEALPTFMKNRNVEFTSFSALGQEIVRKQRRGIPTPRFNLPDEQAALWVPDNVLHATSWGDREAAKNDGAQFDKNKAHLPSIKQAHLAPLLRGEAFVKYGSDAPVSKQHGGMYLIEVPKWTHVLPNIAGSLDLTGDTKWVTPEIMALYKEFGVEPRIIEAWLAPTRVIKGMTDLSDTVASWLKDSTGAEREIAKRVYQNFAGALNSPHNKTSKTRIYRPDWGNAIINNSWCNVLRDARKVYELDNRFVPLRVNVDALYYPKNLGTPPGLKIGDNLGQYSEEV